MEILCLRKLYCRSAQLVHLRMSVDLMKPFVIIAHPTSFHIVPYIFLFEVSLKFFFGCFLMLKALVFFMHAFTCTVLS